MSAKSTETNPVLPCHWTNGNGEVLIVKRVPKGGIVRGRRDEWARDKYGENYEFRWPLDIGATVGAPDWDEQSRCGGGLHGWPWGLAIGDGAEPDWQNSVWLVVGAKVEDGIVDLGGKCKFRKGIVRFVSSVGGWQDATNFVLSGQISWIEEFARGAASATGQSGAASATGERGAASATGERGAASATGWRGAASATGVSGAASATGARGAASATGQSGAASATGWRGAASATGVSGAASATGESGAASATGVSGAASATGVSGAASATGVSGAASATGARGAASATGVSGAASATGVSGAAVVTGMSGKAMAGPWGMIALAWWNANADRSEMRCAEIGCGDGSDGKLKAGVWYQLDSQGHFCEVA